VKRWELPEPELEKITKCPACNNTWRISDLKEGMCPECLCILFPEPQGENNE